MPKYPRLLNTLRPRQNGRHFADIFKCIFLNENVWIPIAISLKFIPKGPINNIAALVQIMARRRSGDKPLSEPMMIKVATHICVARPQWVKPVYSKISKYAPTNLTPTPNLKSTLHRLISAATGLWVPCTNGYQIWWPNFGYQIWFCTRLI